ncbi:MAG: hypothetical protein NT135_00020 [Candidatus Berkelbacteria bacterium]|nr:hypothetical protein [Candidatus Berkelbacteria bacterium]
MAWKDHDFRRNTAGPFTSDNEWDVVDCPGKKSASGLRWVGFWPIYSIVKYDLTYRAIELVGGKEVVETHELGGIGYFTLKQHINWMNILDAESAGAEDGTGALRFDIEFLLGLQIVNPYKAHYGAPGDWNANTVARFSSFATTWVRSKSPKQLLTTKRRSEAATATTPEALTLYQEATRDPAIRDIERIWGIRVIENGFEIRDVSMTEKLQEAFAAEQEQKLRAKGLAAQTADPVMQYLSAMTGKAVGTLQAEYNGDPEVFNKRYHQQVVKAEEMAEQVLPLAHGRTQHMFPGADGIGKLLLGLVTIAKGGNNTPPSPSANNLLTTPPAPPAIPPGDQAMTKKQADDFWALMEERIKEAKG